MEERHVTKTRGREEGLGKQNKKGERNVIFFMCKDRENKIK